MNRYVITGAPCSGKTTTVNALKEDFNVVEEAARKVLVEVFDGKPSKNVDRDKFQREIFKLQEKQFKNLDEVKAFFDRGFGDTLAYYLFDRLKIPEDLLEKAKNKKYDKVFFLESLDFYYKDDLRNETEEELKEISKFIFKVYSDLGYDVIKVPKMPVKDRISFIKKRV